MAKDTIMKAEIKVTGIKEIKNLIELLSSHFDELPIQLQTKLKKIESKFGISDITRDILDEMYTNGFIEENSLDLKKVVSVNQVLQRVQVWDDGLKSLYPNHYWTKINGDILAEW